MRHLVLVRHGESELNAVNRQTRIYCGQIETPLTALGRQQAVAAARQLAELDYLRLTHAISSPLSRARETLQLMLAELNRPIEVLSESPALLERSHGLFEGRGEDEVFTEFPHYRDDPNYSDFMNHFEQCAPGGENLATVTARAWPVAREIVEASAGDVLVVSHYNTIRCIVGQALNLPAAAVLQMRPQNAMPVVLQYSGEYRLLTGPGILNTD